jgi:hypothetical protein
MIFSKDGFLAPRAAPHFEAVQRTFMMRAMVLALPSLPI